MIEKLVNACFLKLNFHLTMHCFICSIVAGNLVLKEHQAARWLTADTLDSVEWLPADVSLISQIKELLKN